MKKEFLQQMTKVIELALEACGGNLSELARRLDTNKAKVSHWKNKKSLPNLESAAELVGMTGAKLVLPGQSVRDFVRLYQIKNDMANAIHDFSESIHKQDLSENLPSGKDLSSIFQRTSDISFKPYILDTLSPDHSKLALYIVTNDETMSPILRKGDQAIVNLTKTKIEDGELYLIEKESGLWIRRIFRDYDKIKLFTESKYLPPTIITPDEFTIIGKVVWIGHFC